MFGWDNRRNASFFVMKITRIYVLIFYPSQSHFYKKKKKQNVNFFFQPKEKLLINEGTGYQSVYKVIRKITVQHCNLMLYWIQSKPITIVEKYWPLLHNQSITFKIKFCIIQKHNLISSAVNWHIQLCLLLNLPNLLIAVARDIICFLSILARKIISYL